MEERKEHTKTDYGERKKTGKEGGGEEGGSTLREERDRQGWREVTSTDKQPETRGKEREGGRTGE